MSAYSKPAFVETASPTGQSTVTWPSRPERVALMRRLVGDADPSVRPLTRGLQALTHRSYDRWVMPLIRTHWPALTAEPFGLKLRLVTCNLYGSAPYTVLLCAPHRPLFFQVVSRIANALPLPLPGLARLGQISLEMLDRLPGYDPIHRRIILVAAFIATIDHCFDHLMDEPPTERGRRICQLIDGHWQPTTAPLRLARALRDEMGRDLAVDERQPYADAMRTLHRWVNSEVAALEGVNDPTGLGHRLAGIEGAIDGLLVGVRRYTGDEARAWMIDVSLFVQMLDDWIDLEGDLESGLRTPVAQGLWTYEDIAEAWHRTVSGLEELVRSAGLTAPHYVDLLRETYILMLREVVEGMADRSAD
jgi:hypothetical protein